MERREGRRIKRRLTCEFFHGTSAHRGIILDIGPLGIFIRTNAMLSPGAEIDIHLAVSVAAPAMTLRGCVVRRRSVPATLTTVIQPGIGVKILDAPREYGLLTADCALDEAIQTDTDFTQAPDTDPNWEASAPAAEADPGADGGDRDRRPEPAPQANTATTRGVSSDTKKRRPQAAPPSAKKDAKREAQQSKRTQKPKPPRPLIAVLVGGSGLDEIAEILRDLGVETIQCGPYDPQLAALDDARLLVVSAEIAMSDPIPVDTDLLVGIAVCGDISETMRSQIRQQGFRYLLRPHVHPEALRLLLRYAVYAERDRRGRVRHPVGCEVSWRVGWRRSRGRLLDISRAGCCLLVRNSPQVGASIAIKIPAETVGGKALKLRGKVLRSTPNAAHSGNERTALGVTLDDITPAARKILVDLCERWSESPPVLPHGERVSAPAAGAHSEEVLASKPQTNDSQIRVEGPSEINREDLPITESQDSSAAAVPRSTRRGVFEREVVQIDEDARVVQALLGRDLSIDGIRVVRQLGLDPGNKLRLALFDTSQQEPLILSAEVSSDEGGSGLFLHFVDLSPEMTARIEAIVSQLPAVESIDPHGDAGVVPAGVVSNQA
ncbi:MAG: PilZ domain-containing protein [Myxococcales bacterium]|nr:PilZ domain-containing protein [Myxococcales bacterium]